MDAALTALALGLVIVIYVPVTYIMLRNISFRPAFKYLFCLTVVPVFVALLVVSMVLVQRYAPETAAKVSNYRSNRGFGSLVLVVYMPFPALGSWLWYLFFRQLDRVFSREA
jgi:cobalamin synthase